MTLKAIYSDSIIRISSYADAYRPRDDFISPHEVLTTAPFRYSNSDLQQIKTWGKEFIILVSGKTEELSRGIRLLDDMYDVRRDLTTIARRIEQRRNWLDFSISQATEALEACSDILSEPRVPSPSLSSQPTGTLEAPSDVSKSRVPSSKPSRWLAQMLETSDKMQKCRGFSFKSPLLPSEKFDFSSGVMKMQEMIQEIDLEECRRVSDEYQEYYKEIDSLTEKLWVRILEVEVSTYPGLRKYPPHNQLSSEKDKTSLSS